MSLTPTIATNEECKEGELVEFMGQRYRIVERLTREAYLEDLFRRRSYDHHRGLPAARAGTYHPETREFKPGREVPPDCTHFYRVAPEEAR